MHRNDRMERIVTKHPGSKSHRKHVRGNAKQRRRDLLVRQREVQSAKLDTMNTQIIMDEVRKFALTTDEGQ